MQGPIFTSTEGTPGNSDVLEAASRYFNRASASLASQVDLMFVWLLAAEWVGLVVAGLVISPRTWSGGESKMHPHLIAAILAGPIFIFPTIALALSQPSRQITRHAIAIAQMLVSSLLIDVTGGRIETHFHIFGSLAFLAFYRDWRVLVIASIVTAADHIVRGFWWPRSVYSELMVSPWRWVEHAGWVVFEDIFLILASRRSVREMWDVATSKAHLHLGAYYDVLTGLPNRRLLLERFDSLPLTEQDRSRAVLFIDLDRFKQANDTLGHTVGDRLLVQIAERLRLRIGGTNTIARVGGDEFVALLNGVSGEQEAVELGTRLLDSLTEPFRVDGHELLLSASVGISLCPQHGSDLATLQERADNAMYVAKSQGRNRCAVYSPEIAQYEDRMKALERDLYHAVPNRELRLYFQPLMAKDGQLAGFEALLRWNHPVHGIVPPTDFIPLAERSGLLLPIGEWVLREACRNCVAWPMPANAPLNVAVNVSAVQLEQKNFAGQVMGIVREIGLEPSRLTLEVTENVLIKDTSSARQQLSELRREGIRIALDDFGTGYSSLSYLVALPADTIKLDRTFVNRDCGNAFAVIESVIEMAHRVGLRVVSEGVETEAQANRLIGLRCDQLQGFYYSRPMPAEEVQRFVEASQVEAEGTHTSELVLAGER